MLKRMLVAVLVMAVAMASVSVLADGEYYEIGSNPMDASRVPNPATDAIVKLASDSPVVSMIGGGGVVATGKRLKAGELLVVDKTTHVAKWVARCGNQIVAPKGWIPKGPVMDLSGGPAQQATQAVATAEQPSAQQSASPQPQQVQVDVNVHQDQQTPQPTYVQEAQPGFWDMVGMSFAQAFAQGLGEGIAYRMVWGGGPGYYGGYYAPVVYYPPAASVYGGGDVFVNKYVTKTIYVNNSTSTWINNPGGPRGGGGGPVDPPADPGSAGGGTGGGTGTGGGPIDPGSNLRAQRKPLTGDQIARDFRRGQTGSSVKPHGPTVGNDAYPSAPSARGGERYRQPSDGGRQIMPPQRQPGQMTPRQNTPRYAPPSGGWQQPRVQPRRQMPRWSYARAPRYYSAPPRSFSSPVFRGGGEYTRPFAPVFRGGGGYSRPFAPPFRGGRR